MRYTIAHEIKHYVFDECDDDYEEDDLAHSKDLQEEQSGTD